MSEAPLTAGTNGEGHTVELTIPARAEYVALCRLALTGLVRARPLPEEVLADLKLALTEAASNSVRHAYADGGGGVVGIRYHLLPDRLVIEVEDEGSGFDQDTTTGAPAGLNEGGLGLAIIRAIADHVEIGAHPNGRGSRLRFEKSLE
jgi:serine/threonine-protein kinase RsbW